MHNNIYNILFYNLNNIIINIKCINIYTFLLLFILQYINIDYFNPIEFKIYINI